MESGYLSYQSIAALQTEIDTSLTQRPVSPSTVISALAWMRRANGVAGVESRFVLPTWGNRAEKRNPYENIPFTKPESVSFSVVHDEYIPPGELIARSTQLTDLYGIFQENLPMIVAQAQLEYDALLADVLADGHTTTTVYDDKPFFTYAAGSGSHQANPNRVGLATFDNFNPSAALNRTNIVAGLQALATVPGFNGLPMSMPGQIVIVVSSKDQELRARTELNATLVASAAGTASQGNQMPLVSGPADVLFLPTLAAKDGGKAWYMFKIVNEKHRPICLSIIEPWQTYVEGLGDPTAHSRVTRNVIQYGVRGTHGCGYLYPHLAYKFIEP
jgi:hypothetical protein